MKKIRSKLNNSQGVSIIIALVFMLMCLFVGGVVLTAASVNSGRMNNNKRNRVFMDHRSAALLVADELKTNGQPLKVEVIKTETTESPVTIRPDGKLEEGSRPAPAVSYKFKVYCDLDKASFLQKMVVEAQLKKLQSKYGLSALRIEYVKPDGTVVNGDTPNFPDQIENVKITANLQSAIFDGYSDENKPKNFEITCKWERENDFVFLFDNSQLSVKMIAEQPIAKELPQIKQVINSENKVNQNNKGTLRTVDVTVTTYVWDDPIITK